MDSKVNREGVGLDLVLESGLQWELALLMQMVQEWRVELGMVLGWQAGWLYQDEYLRLIQVLEHQRPDLMVQLRFGF